MVVVLEVGPSGPQMVEGIYRARTFVVKHGDSTPSSRTQAAGIAQGCPLSPYLFIIVMSVLLQIVDQEMIGHAGESNTKPYLITPDVLYADDTMLVAEKPEYLQEHLNAVVRIGRTFGLDLNVGKTILLRIRSEANIQGPDGEFIPCQSSAVYLGGLLSVDGQPKSEVTKRLGEAKGAFEKIRSVWNHANLSKQRKIKVLEACVFSKLLYGLESCMLLQADRAKLDAFQARCLRRIVKIAPAYFSRVSNASVLNCAGAQRLSDLLLQRQLLLYGRLAREPTSSLPRRMLFAIDVHNNLIPRSWGSARARGRPRLQWRNYIHSRALEAFRGGTPTGSRSS